LSRQSATTVLCVISALLAGCGHTSPPKPAGAAADPATVLLGTERSGAIEPTPRGADGRPLLTGYWKLLREPLKPDGNLGKDEPNFALPYTARGQKALEFNISKTIDPEARCLLSGVPRALTGVLPLEVLQTPDRLAFFFYLGWHRWVWLDGRESDADPDPHYYGNAVGHWDGDTLVIESSGFKDSADGKLWLDDNANPQSGAARLIERWTRPNRDHLDLELSYVDSTYYTRPVHYTRHWVLGAAGETLDEFSCEWNTPWILAHLEPGPGKIGPDGNRGFGPAQVVPDLPLGSVDSQRGDAYWLYRKNSAKPSDPTPPLMSRTPSLQP
jgi:hypothetical protein